MLQFILPFLGSSLAPAILGSSVPAWASAALGSGVGSLLAGGDAEDVMTSALLGGVGSGLLGGADAAGAAAGEAAKAGSPATKTAAMKAGAVGSKAAAMKGLASAPPAGGLDSLIGWMKKNPIPSALMGAGVLGGLTQSPGSPVPVGSRDIPEATPSYPSPVRGYSGYANKTGSEMSADDYRTYGQMPTGDSPRVAEAAFFGGVGSLPPVTPGSVTGSGGAAGSVVGGRGWPVDDVPAILSAGEYVLTPQMIQALGGNQQLERIRRLLHGEDQRRPRMV